MDTCFNCGKNIKTDRCPYCGYSFSIEDACPRRKGMMCIHTKKVCSNRKYETCKILRAND